MSNQPLAKRFARAFAAQGFGQAVSILVQVASVPLLISAWGQVRYGEWLILSAIPAYLSIADLSFASAGSNEMAMRAGAGDEPGAQQVYQSTWALVLLLSFVVMLVGALAILGLPFDHWLKLHGVPHDVLVASILFLVAQVVLSQQGAVFLAGYRAGGHFATGIFAINLLRLAEFLALLAVLRMGGGFVALTGWVFVVRAVGYVVTYVHLCRAVPWLRLGFRNVDMGLMRPLIAPALSYNAVPLGNAMNLQGTVFVVGALFGPTGVVAFNTMRTLSRFVMQVVILVSNSAWPEFSRALGAGDLQLARRLHVRACQVGLWIGIVGAGVLAVIGPWVYSHWTKGQIELNYPVFLLLLLGVVVSSLWNVTYAVPVSVNKHLRPALIFLLVATIGIGLSAVLGRLLGLAGVALGLIAVECVMVWVAISSSMAILEEPVSRYPELMRPPFRWLYGRLAMSLKKDRP